MQRASMHVGDSIFDRDFSSARDAWSSQLQRMAGSKASQPAATDTEYVNACIFFSVLTDDSIAHVLKCTMPTPSPTAVAASLHQRHGSWGSASDAAKTQKGIRSSSSSNAPAEQYIATGSSRQQLSRQVVSSICSSGTAMVLTLEDGTLRCMLPTNPDQYSPLSHSWGSSGGSACEDELSRAIYSVVSAGSDATRRCTLRIPVAALAPAIRRARGAQSMPEFPDGEGSKKKRKRGACDGEDNDEEEEEGNGTRCTLQSLLDEGIPGLVLPLKRVGMCRADIPYVLRDRDVHAIRADMHEAKAKKQPKRKASPHHQNQKQHQQQTADAACFRARQPTFENMCGSAFVYGYQIRPSNVPYCCGTIVCGGSGPNGCRDAAIFGNHVVDIFSVYGNICLRSQSSGTAITFKGARDVSKIVRTVDQVLKRVGDSSQQRRLALPGGAVGASAPGEDDENESDAYKVHMAVLTASIGKRVPVISGNIMATSMQQAMRQMGGDAIFTARTDETCNKEIFQLVGWDALWRFCRGVRRWRKAERRNDSSPAGAGAAPLLNLSEAAMPSSSWKIKVTVYARGNVIIQLSWKDEPIAWSEAVCNRALNACRAVCMLLENCC